ncbi:MAG: hypothetical protein K6U14_02700 [Firmicutes bacterium]|nr:hypothetical protein [Alicyclobacillaceae bacterium]MCL6496530.1 hypothetical protein [Bacillota bacterium]
MAPVMAEALALGVGRGERGTMEAVVVIDRPWDRVALLGPRDRALARVWAGARLLAEAGYRVLWRREGGTAALLDTGCLAFCVIRAGQAWEWRRHFAELTAGVRQGLERLGVPVTFGEAPDTWCPGPYDFLVGTRKLGGVAQAIRQGYTLVGGIVPVHQDRHRVASLLEQFYAAAGSPRRIASDATITVAEWLGRPVTVDEVARAILTTYAAAGPVVLQPSEADWQRAEALYAERLVLAPPV